MTDKHRQPRFDALIQLRAPRRLIVAIRRAAAAKGLSSSAYVRIALVEKLHHDGAQAA